MQIQKNCCSKDKLEFDDRDGPESGHCDYALGQYEVEIKILGAAPEDVAMNFQYLMATKCPYCFPAFDHEHW